MLFHSSGFFFFTNQSETRGFHHMSVHTSIVFDDEAPFRISLNPHQQCLVSSTRSGRVFTGKSVISILPKHLKKINPLS